MLGQTGVGHFLRGGFLRKVGRILKNPVEVSEYWMQLCCLQLEAACLQWSFCTYN